MNPLIIHANCHTWHQSGGFINNNQNQSAFIPL